MVDWVLQPLAASLADHKRWLKHATFDPSLWLVGRRLSEEAISQSQIADEISVADSPISRELRRNRGYRDQREAPMLKLVCALPHIQICYISWCIIRFAAPSDAFLSKAERTEANDAFYMIYCSFRTLLN